MLKKFLLEKEIEMKLRQSVFGLIFVAALLLAACSAPATTPEAALDSSGSEIMVEEETADDMMENENPGDIMEKQDSEEMTEHDDSGEMMEAEESEVIMENDEPVERMELPDWFKVQLTDVSSGENLTVADLKGKVILVETMAIWCSNCLRQQQEVKGLHDALGEEDGFVTLVLDIDPNENAENLKAYTDKHGFSWHYAVAPAEVAREIGQLYGDQFLNPPSTPMLIIDQHGVVHPLPFGIKSAADLQAALEPFLKKGM
jgi:hypothetical protein